MSGVHFELDEDDDVRVWVLQTTTEVVGTHFAVRPRGGSFICEVAQVIPEKELLIRYVDGLHLGTGLWTFERQGDRTTLCYKIDLEPQGWLPRNGGLFLPCQCFALQYAVLPREQIVEEPQNKIQAVAGSATAVYVSARMLRAP